MSRSGYSEDYDGDLPPELYRTAVRNAINGKRGQAFFKEMLSALDSLPEKKLIAEDLEHLDGNVCAIGSVGKARGIDMSKLRPEYARQIANVFGISECLVREIEYENDEGAAYWKNETPEERFVRMRNWVVAKIRV